MTWRHSLGLGAGLAMLVVGWAGAAEAQGYYEQQPAYQQGCVSDAQCGPGTACVSGVCAAPAGQVQYIERPITGLIVGGSIMIAAGYVVNLAISALVAFALAWAGLDAGGIFGWALVPIIGPFVQMGYLHQDSGWLTWLGVMGGLQVVGLTMVILGAVLRVREPVYALGEGRTLSVLPTASPTHGGLTMSLTF